MYIYLKPVDTEYPYIIVYTCNTPKEIPERLSDNLKMKLHMYMQINMIAFMTALSKCRTRFMTVYNKNAAAGMIRGNCKLLEIRRQFPSKVSYN